MPSWSGVTTTSVKDGRMNGEESPCTGTDTHPSNTEASLVKSLTTKLKEVIILLYIIKGLVKSLTT